MVHTTWYISLGLWYIPVESGSIYHDATFQMIEGIVAYSSAARDYIRAAVPSGAAQEALYPAGTLGDHIH